MVPASIFTGLTMANSLLAKRRALLGGAYRLFYEEPLHIVRGRGCYLYDAQGRRYLDAYNNVPHVGHCHPQVVAAISQQAATLNTHTRYLHEHVLDLAEQITDLCADGLAHMLFACSGTEANDLALRLARARTGAEGVIVTESAYHGHSCAVVQLSTEDTPPARRGDHIVTIPAPDSYRRRASGPEQAADLDQALAELERRGHRPAAFFLDTVLSSEGIATVPEGYLPAAVARVRAAGGLFVADEVQAGYGRSGVSFWGHERLGVVPDMITMGKPMGNGHPISGLVTSADVLDAFTRESHYFNTFGGNPVSCAAALAVLAVMRDEQLMARAQSTGAWLRAELEGLAAQHEVIGDVRGSGLFLGLDLVQDRTRQTPATDLAAKLVNAMRQRGVLLGRTGLHGNVLKIRPPMVFAREDGSLLLEALADSLAATT